ncbi:MAG: sugar nucleotide-binding protein [Nitrospirae bacterium]|nr:sugar nucleotide-binding protein [Nitrospirota bacterium]MDA1303752.1 sugar nucleotide-binding protein [Nitrospirota bacterium]
MLPSTLLFGATSLLGFHLATMFSKTVLPFISPGNRAKAVRQWPALQLHDPAWIADVFQRTLPDLLLYCHAVCDVPKCEVSPEWAYDMNVQQLGRVIEALPEHTRLVYVSSDHVFGGDGVYTENSCPSPISVYGRTRVEAEQCVLKRPGTLVIRTGLGIGESPDGRSGHLDWLRYRTKRNLPITIIEDESRSVVWQQDLATRVMQLAQSKERGIGHIAGTRVMSRVELANFLIRKYNIPTTFNIETRHQQTHPHLGRVELATAYEGNLSQPLSSVLD